MDKEIKRKLEMKKPELKDLTLREKIGQMLLVSQNDIYYEDDKLITENEVGELLQKENYGAYFFEETDAFVEKYGKSELAEYRKFTEKQSSYGKIPPFWVYDGEKGLGKTFKELSEVCTHLAVGATGSEKLAEELGESVAKEARIFGASLQLGPVLDMCHRFDAYYMRSFAPDNSDDLIKISKAYIKGVQKAGVAACVKHFPGQDRFDYRDSHISPKVISTEFDEWEKEQGRVFKETIDSGVNCVMVGHISFPAVDDSALKGKFRPASVSKKIVTDLLKNKMGFSGVVITDKLNVAGITSRYSNYDDMLIDLVNAGNDILSYVDKSAGDIIEKAVKAGKIDESRIDDACTRILNLKEKIGLFDSFPNVNYTLEDTLKETKKINRKIAEKAITLVCDTQNLIPVDETKIKNVTIVCSTHTEEFTEKLEYMKQLLEKRGIKAKIKRKIADPGEMEMVAQESDLIIYAAYVFTNSPRGHMSFYGDECETFHYAFSNGQKKSIGLSMGYPYLHYDIMGNGETFVNAYGDCPALMEAFINCIFGDSQVVGRTPVKIVPDQIWY